jgi:hypothetical protein
MNALAVIDHHDDNQTRYWKDIQRKAGQSDMASISIQVAIN